MIAALVIAGNTLIDRPDRKAGGDGFGGEGAAALAVVTSSTPPGIAFSFASHLALHRVATAAAQEARTRKRRRLRRARQEKRDRFASLPGSVSRGTLESIAACESGGDPEIVSANGLYHGKYQFSPETWKSVGGDGSPAAAPEVEQDFRAALLYERSGPGQWPVCGS